MSRKPFSIYLDTSDFSRLAEVGTPRETKELGSVFRVLSRAVECGDVEVRYSAIHIAEIAKSETKELAHRKAAIIESLCGDRCFRSFVEVWQYEIWSFLASQDLKKQPIKFPYRIKCDEGNWMFN